MIFETPTLHSFKPIFLCPAVVPPRQQAPPGPAHLAQHVPLRSPEPQPARSPGVGRPCAAAAQQAAVPTPGLCDPAAVCGRADRAAGQQHRAAGRRDHPGQVGHGAGGLQPRVPHPCQGFAWEAPSAWSRATAGPQLRDQTQREDRGPRRHPASSPPPGLSSSSPRAPSGPPRRRRSASPPAHLAPPGCHRRRAELEAQARALLERDSAWHAAGELPPNMVAAHSPKEFKRIITSAAAGQLVIVGERGGGHGGGGGVASGASERIPLGAGRPFGLGRGLCGRPEGAHDSAGRWGGRFRGA